MRRAAWIPAALLLVVALALVGPAPAGDPNASRALSEEDIVRMFVSGTSTREIIEAIRTREVSFRLEPELLDELRYAGLPTEVIDAMVARQAELMPAEADAAAPEPPTSSTFELHLRLNPDRKPDRPAVLRVTDAVSPQLRRTFELDAAAVGESFEDLAIFLVCRSSTHVPDHWRNASPLGRDFISMPRHRLLAFVGGATRQEHKKGPDTLELEIPASIDAPLDPEASHDLTLGIAVKVAGRYYRYTDDSRDGVRLESGGEGLTATLSDDRKGRVSGLEVELTTDEE